MAGLDQQFQDFKTMIAALRGGSGPTTAGLATAPMPSAPAFAASAPAFPTAPVPALAPAPVPAAQYMFPVHAANPLAARGVKQSAWNWKLLVVAGLLVIAVAAVVIVFATSKKPAPSPAPAPTPAPNNAVPTAMRTAAGTRPVYGLRQPGQGQQPANNYPPMYMPQYNPNQRAAHVQQTQPPPEEDSFMTQQDIERYKAQHLAHYKAQGMSEEEATVYVTSRLQQMMETERQKRAQMMAQYRQRQQQQQQQQQPMYPEESARMPRRMHGGGGNGNPVSNNFDDVIHIDTAPTSDGGFGEGQAPPPERRRRQQEDDDDGDDNDRGRYSRNPPPSYDDDDDNDRYTQRDSRSRNRAGKVSGDDVEEYMNKRAALDASLERGRGTQMPGGGGRRRGGGGGGNEGGGNRDSKFTPLD